MPTVLIVDDSKLARIVVGKALAALRPDWLRLEAGNAQEALELLGSEAVHVAILDYNMPGQNGLALAGTIRERFPAMPIALATANVQDEVIAGARAVDASFVYKPINADSLRGFISGAALRLRDAEP